MSDVTTTPETAPLSEKLKQLDRLVGTWTARRASWSRSHAPGRHHGSGREPRGVLLGSDV